jgi:hypothetical protein
VRKPTEESLQTQLEPHFFEGKPDPVLSYDEKEYLLQFDLSLKYPTVWVSEKTFQCLNNLRNDMVNV